MINNVQYSSGESDSEYVQMFTYLTTDEKIKRILELWSRAYRRLRASSLLLHKLSDTRQRILVHGKIANVDKYQGEAEIEIVDVKSVNCIILPDNIHKQRWDIFLGFLLIYVGAFVPLRVAFFDEMAGFMLFFETLIDLCFAVDIVLTFFTAYEKNKTIEVRHKQIAKQYLKGWFIIDLIATIPFQLIELAWQQSDDVKLIRFTRVPRIYRIVRILRLLKMFRMAKGQVK